MIEAGLDSFDAGGNMECRTTSEANLPVDSTESRLSSTDFLEPSPPSSLLASFTTVSAGSSCEALRENCGRRLLLFAFLDVSPAEEIVVRLGMLAKDPYFASVRVLNVWCSSLLPRRSMLADFFQQSQPDVSRKASGSCFAIIYMDSLTSSRPNKHCNHLLDFRAQCFDVTPFGKMRAARAPVAIALAFCSAPELVEDIQSGPTIFFGGFYALILRVICSRRAPRDRNTTLFQPPNAGRLVVIASCSRHAEQQTWTSHSRTQDRDHG